MVYRWVYDLFWLMSFKKGFFEFKRMDLFKKKKNEEEIVILFFWMLIDMDVIIGIVVVIL